MKTLIPTYIIKNNAKLAMRGNFLRLAATVFIPPLAVFAVALLLVFLVPVIREPFELVFTGNFATNEDKIQYFAQQTHRFSIGINIITVLFSFLSLGAIRSCLSLLSGKKIRVRDVFCFFDRWYIAILFPLVNTLIVYGADYLSALAVDLTAQSAAAVLFSNIVSVGVWVLQLKLMFTHYALAENNCTDPWGAVKLSWQLTDFRTIASSIILVFSFTGWLFLSAFTYGTLLLYIYPYMELSTAVLYCFVKHAHSRKYTV